jgi:DNA-binding response OmpR family regulator
MAKNSPIVVVVDPNPQTRELLRHALIAEFDAHVLLVDHTSNLMDTLLQVIPNAVIVGIHALLDMERIRQVRSVPQLGPVPILALIGWGKEFDCASVLRVGCTDCLDKPFELSELIDKVGSHLTGQGRARPAKVSTQLGHVTRSESIQATAGSASGDSVLRGIRAQR